MAAPHYVYITEEARSYLGRLIRYKYKSCFVSYLIIKYAKENPHKFEQLVHEEIPGMSVDTIRKFLEDSD